MVLLCASVLFNILLLGVVVVAEQQSHVFAMALERRDIVHLEDKFHPDYWARVGWTNTIEKLHTDFDIVFFGNSCYIRFFCKTFYLQSFAEITGKGFFTVGFFS